MGGFLHWVVARRLLTLAGFGVILLGAFVPWPNLAIAAVVIVLGAVLLVVQIPIAMRDATDQLDGFDQPEEQWQSPRYEQYQPPAQFQAEAYSEPQSYAQPQPYQQPQPYRQPQPAVESAPAWQPANIPRSPVPVALEQAPEPSRQVDTPVAASQPASAALPQPEPVRPLVEPAPVWQPKNIPQPAAPQPAPSRVMYEPAPVWQPQNIRQSQEPEPSPGSAQESDAPSPAWKVGDPAPAWRPKNIPQH